MVNPGAHASIHLSSPRPCLPLTRSISFHFGFEFERAVCGQWPRLGQCSLQSTSAERAQIIRTIIKGPPNPVYAQGQATVDLPTVSLFFLEIILSFSDKKSGKQFQRKFWRDRNRKIFQEKFQSDKRKIDKKKFETESFTK